MTVFILSFQPADLSAQRISKVTRDHRVKQEVAPRVTVRDQRVPRRTASKRSSIRDKWVKRRGTDGKVARKNYVITDSGAMVPMIFDKLRNKKKEVNCFVIPCPDGAPEGAVCWKCSSPKNTTK